MEMMCQLINAGADVFRFNMKHNTVAWHEERIARADAAAASLGKRIGILIDLQGPEIRIETRGQQPVEAKQGEAVKFADTLEGNDAQVCIPHKEVFELMQPGDEMLIDDGFGEFDVVEKTENTLTAKARTDYVIKHRKGLNLPGKSIPLPSLIAADFDKLDMATRTKVDFVGLSFCRSKQDLDILRAEMDKRGIKAWTLAKVESQESINNIDEIIQTADAVMVARGDLGVELPFEQLAFLQKQIIDKCRAAQKPVIVATQMLQSMIENPRPTRAEATDVSNAVWDGTDAVMLSGETASGNFPIKAVEAMCKIVKYNEEIAAPKDIETGETNNTQAIALAAKHLAKEHTKLNLGAILVFTQTGYTAKSIAAFRLGVPIIAVTNDEKTAEELTLAYGINTFVTEFPNGEAKVTQDMLEKLKKANMLSAGELALTVHGTHWNQPGLTNALSIITIE